MDKENIKKALECCKDRLCEVCPRLKQEPNQEEDCRLALIGQSLTLINELESENERLVEERDLYKEQFNELEPRFLDLQFDNQDLKDRIAELEKENAKLLDSVETVQSNRCVYKCVLTKEHLTKFAERLKEKFNRQEKRFADTVNRYENGLDKVKESNLPTAKYLIGKATGQATMAEKAQYYIDETLKECLCEKQV